MRLFRRRAVKPGRFDKPVYMPDALYRLLIARGISSEDEAEEFLHPSITKLLPPDRLDGVSRAAEIIRGAIDKKNRICVYGDYDVDGVSASAIIYLTIREMGGDCEAYIPSRHEEGYGLNDAAVREIAKEYKLLLTVDCGITSASLVKLAKSLGLEVIVTDHHLPEEKLPDCLCIDPHICDYPEKTLCGAGVAYKLAEALLGRDEAKKHMELAALATVADIVPLTGENRVIVKRGLDIMNSAPRLGLNALREVSGLEDKPFTSGMLGFQIGPRLNASGRIGSARRAFELLTTKSPDRARELAFELNSENSARKKLEEDIETAAVNMLDGFDFINHRAIVLSGENWNSGVIGLAASRIVERYHYPAILISISGDIGVGSCRSIPGVGIHAALAFAADTMIKFGGHAQAAGLTIEVARIPDLIAALDMYIEKNIDPNVYIPVDEYDMDLSFSELDARFVTCLDMLAPTGFGNPSPSFRAAAKVADKRRIGLNGAHLSMKLYDGTNYIRALKWRDGRLCDDIGDSVDAVFSPMLNTFNGRTSVEITVNALNPNCASETSKERERACIAPFLTQMIYNKPSTDFHVEVISVEELISQLKKNPIGTLIVAGDSEIARRIDNIDVYFSKYPDSPVPYNAVCALPSGEMPDNYGRYVFVGVPAARDGYVVNDFLPWWASDIPDINALRKLYTYFRHALPMNSGEFIKSADIQAIMACVIFESVDLIHRDGDMLCMSEFKKVDIESSEAYKVIKYFGKGGAARG